MKPAEVINLVKNQSARAGRRRVLGRHEMELHPSEQPVKYVTVNADESRRARLKTGSY
jgi:hypothetical protein